MRFDNDTIITVAGFAVLAVSLALPMAQQFAEKHEVRSVQDVAVKAAELKEELMASRKRAKELQTRMGRLVSPGAALADAEVRPEVLVDPVAKPVSARQPEGEVDADQTKGSDYEVVAEWDADGRAKLEVKTDARKSRWAWSGQ